MERADPLPSLEEAFGNTIGYLKPYKDRQVLGNKELGIER